MHERTIWSRNLAIGFLSTKNLVDRNSETTPGRNFFDTILTFLKKDDGGHRKQPQWRKYCNEQFC